MGPTPEQNDTQDHTSASREAEVTRVSVQGHPPHAGSMVTLLETRQNKGKVQIAGRPDEHPAAGDMPARRTALYLYLRSS